ncbi:hypothetical protein DFA_01961 [Cavenderia fasciculata]|uniref:Uncharacterized protein n=1 Tax=Cavenderia fasciculata TaxID=261658 RepID=F4PR14_CACFS|nr:uncharacterized protein DFA_01961 [Cavenderia fasciculata]EGG22071.1 hypothetical protein DFA_01961 [Cavenderia fasciculata]|eukprot:XP_004359922.1 hypothetical protein DFA_01961 [Cavenderia fasciculata]
MNDVKRRAAQKGYQKVLDSVAKDPLGSSRKQRGGNRPIPMQGAGFWYAIKKVNGWLQDTKAISKVAKSLDGVVPFAGKIGSVAEQMGYGKKREDQENKVVVP